jgi:hypothetical protein
MPVLFGFNGSPREHQGYTDRVMPLRPRIARLPIPFNLAEIAWWTLDPFVSRCNLRGIRPLVCLYNHGSGNYDRLPWAAQQVANRHNNAIIQLWNEPNSPDFDSIPWQVVREECAQARSIVRPETKLLGPPMNPSVDGYEDYQHNVHAGLGIPASAHIYPYRSDGVAKAIEDFQVAKSADPEVWVTEIGFQRHVYGGQQPKLSVRAWRELKSRGAGCVIFHHLANAEAQNEWHMKARLWFINRDGSPSGLYEAFDRIR